jgi:hypothetical protein
MTDEPNNLILEHLGPIRGDIAAVKGDIAELRTDVVEINTRLGHLEGCLPAYPAESTASPPTFSDQETPQPRRGLKPEAALSLNR